MGGFMGEEEEEDQVMFTLTIPLGGGSGTPANPISVQGPAVPGAGVRPAITISRYANGRFRFRVGVGGGDSDPIEVPDGIRKWYDDLNQRVVASGGGRFSMPSCRRLCTMTYDNYDLNRRLWYTGSIALNGEIWPYLPRDAYQEVVNRCRQQARQGR